MATTYPANIDNSITLPTAVDNFSPVRAVTVNALRDSIIAVQAAVGTQPAGTYGTVSARLNYLETNSVIIGGDISGSDSGLIVTGIQTRPVSSVSPAIGQSYVWNGAEWIPGSPDPSGFAFGDLGNSYPNPIVIGLQGNPISNQKPTLNQFLSWNGSEWTPSSVGPSFIAGGDLSGFATNQTVIGIQGKPVSSTAPTTGQSLIYNGTQYVPTTQTYAGDLSGTSGTQTVIGLYNHSIANTVPVASAVPIYDTSLSRYDIRPLTSDDLAPPFTIGLSGSETVEIGQPIVNPTLTASYSGSSAASAFVTNTISQQSPLNLTSPYTSVPYTTTFVEDSQTSVYFTLQATSTGSVTKTDTNAVVFNWFPRSFAGVGHPGATGTVTYTGNNAILSTNDIVFNQGLFSSFVGQSVSFSPSSQNIYFLLTGGSHTFVDNSNQNPFPFNAPTPVSFVNQYSQTVSMYLYQSSTTLTGTYSIKVSG